MTVFTEGIRPIGRLQCRIWDGAVADLWHARGEAGAHGHYVSPDPRLVIFLDDTDSTIRVSDDPAFRDSGATGRISFIPAGMPLWSRIGDDRPFSHLDLHFDRDALLARAGARITDEALDRPVMIDAHPQIMTLAGLMAGECRAPGQPDLFADGLMLSMLAALFAGPAQQAGASGLTDAQLRRIERHVLDALHRRVPVGELAEVLGLSESWFAHAFKRRTGESPYRWQLSLRLDACKEMLANPDHALADIAAACGFADQAHLTRAFRGHTGVTPAAYRRAGA
ncbi:helix-turn-helix domain-containing protein [Pseudooceanicola sp. LIPI14-2-Ac024]|uniref:helix-turn-helix domain-containing protein n=1 Tax=Pseudooceanicola sp. LIPI14-2-Ac024 TaxID=3344875 RepID=UPI0035CF5FAC